MDTTRSGREELEGYAGNGTVRWQVLLHRFTGEAVGKHESYGRPPRRLPQLVGIVPGSAQDPTKPVVLGVIDTSGSLSNRDLQLIAAELEKLAGLYKVIVVQCDARIRDVSPHRGRIKQICGRGSTDLRPPLTRRFLQRHRADVVVYFTDGFGPAPKRRPVRPVIWCLAAGGQRPAPYGRAVWMHHGI